MMYTFFSFNIVVYGNNIAVYGISIMSMATFVTLDSIRIDDEIEMSSQSFGYILEFNERKIFIQSILEEVCCVYSRCSLLLSVRCTSV